MNRKISASLGALALSMVAASSPAPPAEADEELPYATPSISFFAIGGAQSSITYQEIWDRGVPDQLWVDPSKPLTVSAYFAPIPHGDDPALGTPLSYQWGYWCGNGTIELGGWEDTYLPGTYASWHPGHGLPGPTLVATQSLSIPGECRDKSLWPGGHIGYFRNTFMGANDTERGASGPLIHRADSSIDPDFELGPDGEPVLYRIVNDEEADVIRTEGSWLEMVGNKLRYFFTSCDAARNFRDWLTSIGTSPSGLAIATAPVETLLQRGLVATVKNAGASNAVVMGIDQGSTALLSSPELVKEFEDGSSDSMCD